MTPPIRLALYLGGHLFGPNVRAFLDLARIAEDVGFDDVALGEHLVLGGDNPTPPWGRFVHRPEEPFPEPLTTLAVIAGATTRVRLITAILIAPLRPAVLLAKQVATLHALSGGRLVHGQAAKPAGASGSALWPGLAAMDRYGHALGTVT